MSNLSVKIDQAKQVIEDAFLSFPNKKTSVAWSAGKDSTLLLKLVLEVCDELKINKPIIFDINQNDQFDELIEFRDRIVKDWDFELKLIENSDFLYQTKHHNNNTPISSLDNHNQEALVDIKYEQSIVQWNPDSPVCCHLLKTVPIRLHIKSDKVTALFTGIRWDEHKSRSNEIYFKKLTDPGHTRVHPLLHFTEEDIWEAIFKLNIPFCSLYSLGYRSLGTKTGTRKFSDIPAWEQDLIATSERGGRKLEKENNMDCLRAWGYV